MARGDSVELVIDTGNGASRTFSIEADKNGRTVEVSHAKGMVDVSVLPRKVGKGHPEPITTSSFAIGRVIAIVEHKVEAAAKKAPQGEQGALL